MLEEIEQHSKLALAAGWSETNVGAAIAGIRVAAMDLEFTATMHGRDLRKGSEQHHHSVWKGQKPNHLRRLRDYGPGRIRFKKYQKQNGKFVHHMKAALPDVAESQKNLWKAKGGARAEARAHALGFHLAKESGVRLPITMYVPDRALAAHALVYHKRSGPGGGSIPFAALALVAP